MQHLAPDALVGTGRSGASSRRNAGGSVEAERAGGQRDVQTQGRRNALRNASVTDRGYAGRKRCFLNRQRRRTP